LTKISALYHDSATCRIRPLPSPEKIDGRKHVTIKVYFTYVGEIYILFHKPEPDSKAA